MKTLFLLIASIAMTGSASAQAEWLGDWEGSVALPEGPLAIAIDVTERGTLLDMPARDLYGFPCLSTRLSGNGMDLDIGLGEGLAFSGTRDGDRIEGEFRQGEAAAPGYFVRSRFTRVPDTSFDSGGTALPGTLAIPDGPGPFPLVILHAGLGAADRNGNNYNVPGRNDALAQLAGALASRGTASYRYDKRGSGAATWLVPDESSLDAAAWVADLAACARHFAADRRFSGLFLLGQNDGAVVAAAAANAEPRVDGVIVACASGRGTLGSFLDAIEAAPESEREAGRRIVESIRKGIPVTELPGYYAESFRPGTQPYLRSLFALDLPAELSRYSGRALLVQGNLDIQVTYGEFLELLAAKPDARNLVVPDMNHALKSVPNDVDENYRAFTSPDFPVSAAFADAVAAFAGARAGNGAASGAPGSP